MNLSGNVSTNAEMGIGRRKCTGNMQFRVSKDFLKNDALKVMFVVQDLLHTGYYYFEANGTQSHRTLTLMQGKPAGNHHGAERDGCGKNQNRKGQDHGALSHGLAYSYSIKVQKGSYSSIGTTIFMLKLRPIL